MNSTLIDFNTCKHSILMIFVIDFVMGCCVGANEWLAWCYKVV